ncbi:liprin-beta-2 isoform X6 [Monodelphis domestica]|uniref:liprin-beta-2 isoform X6 n=1 Tax=Monodelphis domestica TaxID=13616 RepID=UPI0024E1CD92|nr:liprin-beta-2 isoform X6 [Monodelphis domestica]
MASDASHMLEAALEQMDGIIAGGIRAEGSPDRVRSEAKREISPRMGNSQHKAPRRRNVPGTKSAAEHSNGAYDVGLSSQSPYMNMHPVLHLIEDLRLSLEMLGDPVEKETLRTQIPESTAAYVKEWLEGNLSQVSHPAAVTNETYQERLARLEGDKESLMLQVSVLTDQVEVQGEKIRDLEVCLEEHQVKLNAAEEMLQQELLSRTSLEAQKLELMAEVSELKLRQVNMEREQKEQEEKKRKVEELLQELKHLKIKVEELESERNQYEWKLKATKAEIAQLQEQLALKDAEIERLHSQLSRTVACSESTERDQEVQRLKIGMETLLVANEEKDRRIEELTLLLSQYQRVKEIMLGAHGSSERILSSGEEELEGSFRKWNVVNKSPGETVKLEMVPRCTSPTLGAPPLPQKTLETSGSILDHSNGHISHCEEDSLETQSRTQEKLSSSLEDLQNSSVEKYGDEKPLMPVVGSEDTFFLGENKYQTLPGKLPGTTHNGEPVTSIPSTSQTSGSSLPSLTRARSVSAPILGETESNLDTTVTSNDLSPMSSGTDSGPQSPLTPEMKRSPKGIKKFWGKIRRTQSGNFNTDAIGIAEFRRGGLRATAGPRLSRTRDPKAQKSDSNAPFAQWNTEQVCSWLEDFGLGQYVIFARQWVSSGHTLLTATPQDMEKELGIKHPLHRKKLVLAVKSINTKQQEKSAQLDHIWVTRWLDDIGLPQYKDQFHESRVDGRMLQYLTVNDLLFLKVTSQLHHLSIKCAIHVLHVNKFNPHCLHRRPADESNVSPSEVVQWSNHRVMEWLRSVDLAEYAPNLRGSGVHGGLIILEPRFSGDTLAMLLNIPPQKTLLRRHLTTNFNVLIGPVAQQEKRDIMASTAYTPLTTTAKVRPKKLGFSHFGNMRKKKFDESTDYICPTEPSESANGNHKAYGGHSHRGLSPSPGEDLDKLDQMEPSEGTVLQIGVISRGIHNLTTGLNQDGLLK